MILMFELCPQCSQARKLALDQMMPMILSQDDKEMQCGACGRSYPLKDAMVLTARERRAKWGAAG